MTIQTCMAGRSSLPIRKLIEKILTGRGHQLSEAPNPARCVDWYGNGTKRTCNLMVVEYAGPETLEMIEILIDRQQILAENVAVFSLDNSKGAQEAKVYGCKVLRHPFRMEELISWALDSEKRCLRKAA